MKNRQFCLTSAERALLAPLDEQQWCALADAARLYDDVIDVLVPPMHETKEIEDARAFLGAPPLRIGDNEDAARLMHWKTGQPLPVCAAFLATELDELEQAGLV